MMLRRGLWSTSSRLQGNIRAAAGRAGHIRLTTQAAPVTNLVHAFSNSTLSTLPHQGPCRPIPAWSTHRSLPIRALSASAGQDFILNVPSMGDSITEGTIVNWQKKVGDWVDADDVIVVLETDKVSVDVRAPRSGIITEVIGAEDDTVGVGVPLAKIDTTAAKPEGAAQSSAPPPTPPPPPPKAEAAAAPPPPSSPPPPSPPSTPPKPPTPAPAPVAPGGASTGGPSAPGNRSETRVKMNRMRLRIAERLKSAQNTAAMLTTFQEVDMGNLMDMRKAYKEEFEKVHGVKLGFMSAFVKASTAALQEIPAVNAFIDDGTKEIVYRDYCDVSVAVASPAGLVVPVLRNAERMSFAGVERQIAMYGKKAKEGALALEDMAGGTFTISNGGVFGSLLGTPIINPPQSAILGMHATKMRAVVGKDGQVMARPMMYLALTYDHRLIDGREAVTFLKSVAAKIEDPRRMVLEL
ncbi:dihydrolipoamide succinyltransferase [Nannochloropsis gaditana]|uniref:dihydrolipoyllysine-residue succinyltransferase n=1 Tax=Nannochloropsis gaditana TaxID=72520 RepID=W7TJE0_9STRA|nr:dihydrolipoamide succinyltransferase [Nannochloropsis gaditana]